MHDAYPTTSDLSQILEAQGQSLPSNAQQILEAVIAEFERGTGYKPFLGESTETTFYFDPPYKDSEFHLNLEGGFWAVSKVEISGQELDASYYQLLPLNAANESRGWDAIRFLRHPGFTQASISVTGKRGYAEKLPNDVFMAILNEAAGRSYALPTPEGTIKKEKQGGIEIEYSQESSFASDAKAAFRSIIAKYRRPIL